MINTVIPVIPTVIISKGNIFIIPYLFCEYYSFCLFSTHAIVF